MQCNHEVSIYNSNSNKDDYIYGDPSHLSTEDELLMEEENQAFQEIFVFIQTSKTDWFKTSNVDSITMIKVKPI